MRRGTALSLWLVASFVVGMGYALTSDLFDGHDSFTLNPVKSSFIAGTYLGDVAFAWIVGLLITLPVAAVVYVVMRWTSRA